LDRDEGEDAEGDRAATALLEIAVEMAAIHLCCMSLLIVDRITLPLFGVTAELLDALLLPRVKRAGVWIDRRLVGVLVLVAAAAVDVVAAADVDGMGGGTSSCARAASELTEADADMLFDLSLLFNQFFLFSKPATVDFLRASRGWLSCSGFGLIACLRCSVSSHVSPCCAGPARHAAYSASSMTDVG